MSIVIDASMTMTWYFKDESTPVSAAVLDFVVEYGAFAPPLWRLEVVNVLNIAIRRKRIDLQFRTEAMAGIEQLPVLIDQDGEAQIWTRTLEFSDRYGLTIYDACYLELADRHQMSLATFDKELINAGRAHGLPVLTL